MMHQKKCDCTKCEAMRTVKREGASVGMEFVLSVLFTITRQQFHDAIEATQEARECINESAQPDACKAADFTIQALRHGMNFRDRMISEAVSFGMPAPKAEPDIDTVSAPSSATLKRLLRGGGESG